MTTLNEAFEYAYKTKEDETGLTGEANCSGFVRMAAKALRIRIEGQTADQQLDYVDRHWAHLKGAMDAVQFASQGYFVVAGLKSHEYEPARKHGHIVVVKPLTSEQMPVGREDMYKDRYPYVWGGDINLKFMSPGTRSIGEIIDRKVRDKVRYYMPLPPEYP